MNNRLGMNQQNSSKQHSQGNEGKRKNERKSTSDTNPFHEVPNSSPGFSDSKPIGKKFKADEDFDQADVKISGNPLNPRFLNKMVPEKSIQPFPKDEKEKNRRDKRNRFLVETESEDEEYEDQNEYSDHFDNSNSDFQKYDDERDENLEEEAEKVNLEDEHENVTPEATNESLNPFNDKDFDKDPDSNKNPSSSTEDDPFVMQPESGYRSVPNSSKIKDGNSSNDQSNKKSAGNSNFNAYDHSNSHGDRRGHPNPQVGIKRLGFSQNKPMGHG